MKRNPSEIRPLKARLLRVPVVAAACVFLATAGIGMLRAGQQAGKAATTGVAFHGVDLEIMDTTCKPCQDFYHYASGTLLGKNPVPAAYPSWGRFSELAERNRELLHQILESAAANTKSAP